MNGIFGQSAGLNVVLPQQGGYAPATKEAIGAATGGNIQIPEYDVAQGMAETEPYFDNLDNFKNFIAGSIGKGVDPSKPLVGNKESLLANQIYRKYISDINRAGSLLAEAKKTKVDLMRGGYEIPAGMDNSATTLIQSAPNAMKKDAISPVAATFVRAIQNDTITADNVERYEAAREKAKVQVAGEAKRLLQENYSQGQVDQYISRSLAALDIPLNVKSDELSKKDMIDFNLRQRKQQLDEAQFEFQKTQGNFNKVNFAPFTIPYTSTKTTTKTQDGVVSKSEVEGDGGNINVLKGFAVPPFDVGTNVDFIQLKGGAKVNPNSIKSITINRMGIVPIGESGKPLSTKVDASKAVGDRPYLFGTVKTNIGDVPIMIDAEANAGLLSNLGSAAKTEGERDMYVQAAQYLLQGGQNAQSMTTEPRTTTQETKTVSRATLKGLLGKAGYEGQTEQSLIDYYKANGYTIK